MHHRRHLLARLHGNESRIIDEPRTDPPQIEWTKSRLDYATRLFSPRTFGSLGRSRRRYARRALAVRLK